MSTHQTGGSPLAFEVLGDTRPLHLSANTYADGVTLSLTSTQEPEIALKFELRVRNPLVHRFNGAPTTRLQWPMTSGLCRGNPGDPFRFARGFAYRTMYGFEQNLPSPFFERQRDQASLTMKRLNGILCELASHSVSACEPKTLSAARRFAAPLRFRMYELMMSDSTGRLAQAARSCPGVLLFAHALREKGGASLDASRKLLGDIQCGTSVNRAISAAIEVWAGTAHKWVNESRGHGLWNPAWERVLNATTSELTQLKQAQRLLIRRAGPMVPPTLLWLPPPIAFAPEDIPTKVIPNAHWFRVMKSFGATLSHGRGAEREVRRALSSFTSRNTAEFPRPSRRRLSWNLNSILDFAIAKGRHPSRFTPVASFVEESRVWHQRIFEVSQPRELRGEPNRDGDGPGPDTDHVFPRFEGPLDCVPNLKVNLLASSKQLVEEGQRMRHCVASRIARAIAGEYCYFSVQSGEERLTVELGHSPLGLTLTEIKGVANRSPTAAELALVQSWVQELNRLKNFATDLKSPPSV